LFCLSRKGGDIPCDLLFVDEDGEENAVHRGDVLESAHGPGASADFAESAFDGVGGSDRFALGQGLVAKAGEQYVEVVAQRHREKKITCILQVILLA
jgi:hypothetical protein